MVDISESPDYIAGTGEHIIDYGSVYNYCVAIDYNPEGVVGKGSAIFLHGSLTVKYRKKYSQVA